MPTITQNSPLGKAFGGSIASINYNIQTGSQANTATMTVVSKTNSFEDPELNSTFSLPPWSTEMVVTEVQTNDDSTTKTLQVELSDSSINQLDKTLILIRGIHSTGTKNDELTNNLYHFFNYGTVPPEGRASSVSSNELFQEATKLIEPKKIGEGLWLLGRLRAVYTPKSTTLWDNGKQSWKRFESPIWAKWEEQRIRQDISKWKGGNVPSDVNDMVGEEGPPSVQYGYTLSDLKKLCQRVGVSIDDKGVMDNDTILFNSSGTLRSALSSSLSKIGRTFYVDPFSKKVCVISNADISRINSNLRQTLNNLENTEGAERLTFKKTIKGVNATHLTLKGTLRFQDADSPDGDAGGVSPRYRRTLVSRVPFNTEFVDEKEIILLKRVALLYAKGISSSVIDKYLYMLASKYNPETWTEKRGDADTYRGYGGVREDGSNDLNYIGDSFSKRGDGKEWETNLSEELDDLFNLNGFHTERTIGAYPITSTQNSSKGVQDEASPPTPPSSQGYPEFVSTLLQLWLGIYISDGVSETRIKKRNYLDESVDGDTFNIEKASADTRISAVPYLSPLYQTLVRQGKNINLTVGELAEIAGRSSSSNKWHVIALRNNFVQDEDLSKVGDIEAALNTNTFLVEFSKSEVAQWMLITESAADKVNDIEDLCLRSWDLQIGSTDKNESLRFEDLDEAEISAGGDSGGGAEEPQMFSIKNVEASINNFESRSLLFIQGDFSEVSLFEQEMNEIAPQNEGPFYSASINYYRAPTREDLNVENGISSISVSMSESGITTNVSYETKKYAQIDQGIILEYLGQGFNANYPSQSKGLKTNSSQAFQRNRTGR